MKIEELSKEVRHKVMEKHCSGEGYKKISKSLIISLSTVKSIIKEWKTCHTVTNLEAMSTQHTGPIEQLYRQVCVVSGFFNVEGEFSEDNCRHCMLLV